MELIILYVNNNSLAIRSRINMSTQEEKQNLAVVAEYFEEYWGKGNAAIVDKLCADDFVINYPMHGPRYGRQAAKQMLIEFKEVRLRKGPCMTVPNGFFTLEVNQEV
jgi:hypothetical protein